MGVHYRAGRVHCGCGQKGEALMDVADVKKDIATLEQQVYNIVSAFERKTGCTVTAIVVRRLNVTDFGDTSSSSLLQLEAAVEVHK